MAAGGKSGRVAGPAVHELSRELHQWPRNTPARLACTRRASQCALVRSSLWHRPVRQTRQPGATGASLIELQRLRYGALYPSQLLKRQNLSVPQKWRPCTPASHEIQAGL